jgi:hypothetical protein
LQDGQDAEVPFDRSPGEEGAAAEEGDAEAEPAEPDALTPAEGADSPDEIGDVDDTVDAAAVEPEGDADAAGAEIAGESADACDSATGGCMTLNACCISIPPTTTPHEAPNSCISLATMLLGSILSRT